METGAEWALIVDGDQEAYPRYRSVLADLGFASEICDNSARVPLMLARQNYRLILLNPRAPGPCAIETLARINQRPDPPAIVLLGEPRDDAPVGQAHAIDGDALRAMIVAAVGERGEPPSPAANADQPAPPELYQQIARIVQIALSADRVSTMLWSEGDERVTVAACAGTPFATSGDTSAPLYDSVSGWVIRNAEPLLISPGGDLPFDLQGMWRGDPWRAGMCVPLIMHGRVGGALTATRRHGHAPFTGADLEIMLRFASQAAMALESDRLDWQARRRERFLANLNGLSALLAASPDAAQAAGAIADHLAAALPGARGYLFLRGDPAPWFERAIAIGAATALPHSNELRDEPGLAGLVLNDGMPRTRQQADAAPDLAAWEARLIEHDHGVLLCAALKTEQAIVGAIELASPEPFDGEDSQFVMTCAALAAPAIERARRHDSLARAKSRYHTLFQRTGDAIFLIDAGTMTIVEANPAAEQMSGYTQAELSMIAPMRLLAPSAVGRAAGSVADMLAGKVSECEGYIRTHGGYSVPVSISAAEVAIDGKRHVLLNARDVAKQQHQASRAAQTEKLAGMSRLTAAIAHEINNPLQALHNTLHLLLNRSFTEEKRERLLAMAQAEVNRLTDLVRRMLELHRPAHADMRPVSVHALLENALAAVAGQIQQHRVEVERDWSDQLPWVIGIGGHLRQVFQDLATNAIEAMPEGGRLVIRTRREEGGGAAARVLVEFADSGPGLSDGEAHLVFEPFYSTKHGNTGLGLAISYSIVERHGGTLSVISGAEGTTFRVALPAAS